MMPRLSDIPQYISLLGLGPTLQPWKYIESWLQRMQEDYGLDLDPDFQRDHVWTYQQQVDYIEHVLRGGETGKLLLFNSPAYGHHRRSQSGGLDDTLILVDGKQRLTAVRAFLRDELPAFGEPLSAYEDSLDTIRHSFLIGVNSLATRRELLEWYIQLNSTGVHHTKEDLDKVRRLIEEEEDHG